MNEATVRAVIQELETQRNSALNRVARLVGELADLQARFDALRTELNQRDNAAA